MHIILHIAAFVIALLWVYLYFFMHGPFITHLILLLAVIIFIFALTKHPGKRTIV